MRYLRSTALCEPRSVLSCWVSRLGFVGDEAFRLWAREEGRALATGTVKFFDSMKGFGFISREDGDDVFVHNSNIEGGDDKASLEEGQTVEFEIGPGRKGDEARNVRVV